MTTIYVLLTGVVLIGLMLCISHLWDRIDKLQHQVHEQGFDINHNRIAVNQLAKDVHKERGNETKKSNVPTYRV